MAGLAPYAGHSHIIGITGSPGVGKSTSTSALVTALRKAGQERGRAGGGPHPPFSGGAILGDRIRMQDHALDTGVFIRSLATRGQLGGLSRATSDCARVLDAMGKDVVLIETVGVGQDEVEICRLAHTTVVVVVPGLGDDIQAYEAGILEVADLFAVNKSDREGADRTVRDLRSMLALAERPEVPGNRRSSRRSPARTRASTTSWRRWRSTSPISPTPVSSSSAGCAAPATRSRRSP